MEKLLRNKALFTLVFLIVFFACNESNTIVVYQPVGNPPLFTNYHSSQHFNACMENVPDCADIEGYEDMLGVGTDLLSVRGTIKNLSSDTVYVTPVALVNSMPEYLHNPKEGIITHKVVLVSDTLCNMEFRGIDTLSYIQPDSVVEFLVQWKCLNLEMISDKRVFVYLKIDGEL